MLSVLAKFRVICQFDLISEYNLVKKKFMIRVHVLTFISTPVLAHCIVRSVPAVHREPASLFICIHAQ